MWMGQEIALGLLAERMDLNNQHPALVEAGKILLPPLHIKLGLMKNFMKAMDRTLLQLFDTCTHILELFKDGRFNNFLQGDARQAWNAFRLLSTILFQEC